MHYCDSINVDAWMYIIIHSFISYKLKSIMLCNKQAMRQAFTNLDCSTNYSMVSSIYYFLYRFNFIVVRTSSELKDMHIKHLFTSN